MTFSGGIVFIDALGWSITVIDIALVLFVLVMAAIGCVKGFVKIVFKLFGTLAVVAGAVLLASTVAEFLIGPFGHYIENPVADWMMGLQADSSTTIFTDVLNWSDEAVRDLYLPGVLEMMGLPAVLAGIISGTGFFDNVLADAGESALIDVLPEGIALLGMTIVAFVLLLVVLGVAMIFIRKLFVGITRYRLFGKINRLLGFLLGAIQAYIIVSIILVILTLVPLQGVLDIVYQQIDASLIANFLAQNNIIGNWLIATIFA